MNTELQRARALLAASGDPVVFTGAGVSAESGIPTFRDALTGLWAEYDPETLATEAGFRANPSLVWDWYASRRERIGQAEPNPAHRAIAAIEAARGRVTVVTQNVDGLHARAGSSDVVELHGSILRARCLAGCGPASGWEADLRSPPRCRHCEAPLRPDVVWFGEWLPHEAVAAAEAAAARCDLMLVVGTSAQVYPAAELPFRARRSGAEVIVINPEPTEIDAIASVVLRGRAGEILPALLP
ncbi:MAG: NAD-dependent deacylase [Burkholderiales bacterium]|nr:MAG: NAD-dependent deacylase [Burkholderiales bacterium]